MFPIHKLHLASEVGSYPPKIGEIEISLECRFDPKLRLKNAREASKANVQKHEEKERNTDSLLNTNNLLNNNYQNPFSKTPPKERPSKPYVDPFSEDTDPNIAEGEDGYKDRVEEIIKRGKDLKSKLMKSERNQIQGLSESLADLLYDGAGEEPLDEMPNSQQFRSKEAELARLNFMLDDPSLMRDDSIGFIGRRNSNCDPQTKYKFDVKDIEKTRLRIAVFNATNPILRSQLKDYRLKLQVSFPSLSEDSTRKEIIENTFNFANRGLDEELGLYRFDQEVISSTELKEGGLATLGNKKIRFVLKGKEVLAGGSDQESFKTICNGELGFEELITSENFKLSKRVPMFRDKNFIVSKLPARHQKANYTQKNVDKEEVGSLEIIGEMFSETFRLITPEVQEIDETPKKPPGKITNRYKDDPILPLCLFMHVKGSRSIAPKSSGKRNLYLEHKIFGTSDSIRSNVVWDSDSPYFEHRILMPLTIKKINSSRTVPLTIALWDKSTDAKYEDELIGFAKICLKSIYNLIGNMDTSEIKQFMLEQGDDLIVLQDRFVPVYGIVFNDLKAELNTYVALGKLRQIEKYKEDNRAITNHDTQRNTEELMDFSNSGTNQHPLYPFFLLPKDPRLYHSKENNQYYQLLPDGSKVEMRPHRIEDETGKESILYVLSDRSNMKEGGELGLNPGALKGLVEQLSQNTKNIGNSQNILNSSSGVNDLTVPPATTPGFNTQTLMETFRADSLDQITERSELQLTDNEISNFTEGEINELKRVFSFFDKNKSGEISQKELLMALQILGKDCSLAQVKIYMKGIDKDASGGISFKEFIKFYKDGMSMVVVNKPDSSSRKLHESDKSKEANKNIKSPGTFTDMGDGMIRLPNSSDSGHSKLGVPKKGDSKGSSVSNSMLRIPTKIDATPRNFSRRYTIFEKKPSIRSIMLSNKPSRQPSIVADDLTPGVKSQSKFASKNTNFAKDQSEENEDKSSLDRSRSLSKKKTPSGAQTEELSGKEEKNYNKQSKTDRPVSFEVHDIYNEDDSDSSPEEEDTEEPRKQEIIRLPSKFEEPSPKHPIKQPAKENSSKKSEANVKNNSKTSSTPSKSNEIISDQKKLSNPTEYYETDVMYADLDGGDSISKELKPPSKPATIRGKQTEKKTESSDLSDFNKPQNAGSTPLVFPSKKDLPTYSSQESESNFEGLDIDADGVEGGYYTKKAIPQFETQIPDNFVSADPLASYTYLLEFVRRYVINNPKIRERLEMLIFGVYGQSKKLVRWKGFEEILRDFEVNLTVEEARPLYQMLKKQDGNGIQGVDLRKMHESLIIYIGCVDSVYFEWFEAFKYAAGMIRKKGKFADFAEYLNENSEEFYISNQYLMEYLQGKYSMNTEVIEEDFIRCGENAMYENAYIFNILNYLLFLMKIEGEIIDFQPINGLHHYSKFLTPIKARIYERAKELFEERSELEVTQIFLGIVSDYQESYGKFSLVLSDFEELLEKMGLQTITEWETLVIFNSLTKNNETISKSQKIDIAKLKAFIKEIFLSEESEFIEEEEELHKDEKILGNEEENNLIISNQSNNFEKYIQNSSLNYISGNVKPHNNYPSRSKLSGEKIKTERQIYEFNITINAIEDLNLLSSCDYCDLSINYTFPGDEDVLESQLFTYIPKEAEYNIHLSSTHLIKCSKSKDILEIFGEAKGLKIFISRHVKAKQDILGFAVIPIDDLISKESRKIKHFLYPFGDKKYSIEHVLGALILQIDCSITDEYVTEKEAILNKNAIHDSNVIERDLTFERGLLPSGVLTILLENLTPQDNTYRQLESLVKNAFGGNNPLNIGDKISLRFYLKVESSSKNTELKPIFEPYSANIGERTCHDKPELFTAYEQIISKDHLINNWRHFNLEMTPNILEFISIGVLHISLCARIMNLSNLQRVGSEAVLSSCEIPLDRIITLQNQRGYRAVHQLFGSKSEHTGAIGITLNYSKEAITAESEADRSITTLKEELKRLDRFECIVRITELIVLKQALNTQKYVLYIKLSFGNKIDQSFALMLPESELEVIRIKFTDNELADSLLFRINFGDWTEYISKEEIENRLYQLRDTVFDPLDLIPKLRIALFMRNIDHGEETEIASTELDLRAAIIVPKVQKTTQNWKILSLRSFLPMGNENKILPARIGAELFILQKELLGDRATQDFAELLGIKWLRSLHDIQQKHKEINRQTSNPEEIGEKWLRDSLEKVEEMPRFKAEALARLVSEVQIDEGSNYINTLVTDPLFHELEVEISNQKRNTFITRLFKEFRYFDHTGDGLVAFSDALKIFIEFSHSFPSLKRNMYENFRFENISYIATDLNREGGLKQKFDYVVFLAHIDNHPFNINDVVPGGTWGQVQKDIEYLDSFNQKMNEIHYPIAPKKDETKLTTAQLCMNEDYSIIVKVNRGEYIDLLANSAFPNTFVNISCSYKSLSELKTIEKKGDLYPRSAEPYYQTELKIPVLGAISEFLAENSPFSATIRIFLRDLNLSGATMFEEREIGHHSTCIVSSDNIQEILMTLEHDNKSTYEKEYDLRMGSNSRLNISIKIIKNKRVDEQLSPEEETLQNAARTLQEINSNDVDNWIDDEEYLNGIRNIINPEANQEITPYHVQDYEKADTHNPEDDIIDDLNLSDEEDKNQDDYKDTTPVGIKLSYQPESDLSSSEKETIQIEDIIEDSEKEEFDYSKIRTFNDICENEEELKPTKKKEEPDKVELQVKAPTSLAQNDSSLSISNPFKQNLLACRPPSPQLTKSSGLNSRLAESLGQRLPENTLQQKDIDRIAKIFNRRPYLRQYLDSDDSSEL